MQNGGIVGRGVLLNFRAWTETQDAKAPCFETTAITVETLQDVAAVISCLSAVAGYKHIIDYLTMSVGSSLKGRIRPLSE